MRAPNFRSERGEGAFGLIATLAVLGIIAGLLWQLVPAWYERYEVGLGMSCALEDATILMGDDQVRDLLRVCLRNHKLDSEHAVKDFAVRRARDPQSGKDRIMLSYSFTREIGLPGTGLTYPLVLTVSR